MVIEGGVEFSSSYDFAIPMSIPFITQGTKQIRAGIIKFRDTRKKTPLKKNGMVNKLPKTRNNSLGFFL